MKRLLIIPLATLAACATHIKSADVIKNARINEHSETSTEQQLSINRQQLEQAYIYGRKTFNYDFTLKSLDTASPAKLVEYRRGKPFRTLEVKNATYTEGKATHDSVVSQRVATIMAEYKEVKKAVRRQDLEIKILKREAVKLKIEGGKIADNFKYLLWFLLAVALAWIGQSTGLFSMIKKLFKAF